MLSTKDNNKRLAKNTAFLYIRMFVIMAVSLFTSRVILDMLGESDYGTYNIIGGIVVLFSMFSQSLTSATLRFLNFTLGQKDEDKTHRVFCMSMNLYYILSTILLLLAETIGLWFVNTQLNIPADRMIAANWIYQFSVITFILNLIRIPYNASLIAYEKMDFYAYLSLLDGALKLLIVYMLYLSPIDKLIFYGFLLLMVNVIDNVCYRVYCNRHFKTTHYKWLWDKSLLKDLFGFSGWSLFGSAASVLSQQGLSIIVNIFFGVVLNAALGIANQISGVISQFYTNFQTAFNPQIVKYYASGEKDKFLYLINRSSKFSFFLMFIISLPIILEIDKILSLWLVKVPEYTGIFCQLILIFFMIEALQGPLFMSIQATGKIRNYQLLVSVINFTTLPVVYLCLKIGLPVWSVWVARILIDIVISVARIQYLQKHISLNILNYTKECLLPIFLTVIAVLPVPLLSAIYLPGYWANFILTIILSLLASIIGIYLIGLNSNERATITEFFLSKIRKK